jgi:hypothetical protein
MSECSAVDGVEWMEWDEWMGTSKEGVGVLCSRAEVE